MFHLSTIIINPVAVPRPTSLPGLAWVAYILIIFLVYINVRLILAFYAEKADIENSPNLNDDLGKITIHFSKK